MSQAPSWQQTSRDDQQIVFSNGKYQLYLTICTDAIIRVRMVEGQPLPHRSWAVTPADITWKPVPWSISTDHGIVRIRTAVYSVIFDTANGTVQFATDDRVFCADVEMPTLAHAGASVAKKISQNECFYGFGERTGALEKTGQIYKNWALDPEHPHTTRVNAMYAVLPMYLAVQPELAYGVFFNTTFRSQFDIGASEIDQIQWVTDGPEIDYYLVFGPTPADVCAGWTKLLGAMPLPPRWALGYHQSRWGYDKAATIRDLAAQFRGRQIPCDTIHFDIDYMDGYRVFTWDSVDFPDPEGLLANLHDNGFKVVTIIDPGVKIDEQYSVYSAGVAQDMFIRCADGTLFHGYVWPDDSVFADYTRPEVRAWWGEQHRALVAMGVKGIWDDMNEPTVFDRPFSEGGGNAGTIDLDAPQGPADERTTHAEVHNLYGYLMARSTREGLLKLNPNERPFVLTRSGFAGLQRWTALWTGDNTAIWEHLEMTLPQLCNLGLSGVPFCGVDIGGFFGNATPELWARWVQLGAFLPFCRGHSCAGTRPAEPWVYGERTESIARAYLTLRYRLLPYLYTLFHEAATTGAPIIRPLLYHFPNDPQTHHGYDQALLGSQLLLAPIIRPGVEHRVVYLPAGDWYDWWTGERISGPIHLMTHAPLERLPLYVRGGAIIPMAPAMQYTDERPLDELTLDIYPAGTSTWTLYEDDGISFDFEQGQTATTTYRCEEDASAISVTLEARVGSWQPAARTLVLNVHWLQPKDVQLDGAPVEWTYADGAATVVLEDDGAQHQLQLRG